ncbi:protein FAM161A isoform X1 [Acipenser ruthenus]|uniref:protein FAM161A isoform X1 n=1 Tax=Acipenser ruthenus TaxID=7906 RepID=UPI0027420CB1|nr:protein FAM161A isoform X1 [Acipenser ruthenus]
MDNSHQANVLVTSCLKTPVNPYTKIPAAQYEREKATRSCQQTETNSQDKRRYNRYYEKENESECDSDTEEMESSFLLNDYRVLGNQLDFKEFVFSNKEYYRKLEELKNAHLDTMAQLERMYQNKMKLKGVVPPDNEYDKTELHCRSQWMKTPNTPTAFSASELNYNVCSSLSDASNEFQADNETETKEKGIILSPREHIQSMWDGFSIVDYDCSEKCQLLFSPKIQKSKRKPKDWSPKITVPEPFHMTVREAEKKKKNFKSRSEIEMENCLLKKQLEELVESQKKFRANPVPAHVYLPLYEEIMERNDERRQFVKERTKELALASQKPFSFIEREEKRKERKKTQVKDLTPKRKKTTFKAKPVPKYINDPTINDRLKEEELYRKIKMQMRSQELLYSSSLPRSMLTCTASGKRKENTTDKDKETDFRPRINTEVPDFGAKYRRFHKQLLKKRDTKPMTVCEPFVLRTLQIPSHRDKILADIQADESRVMESRWPYISPDSQSKPRCLSAISSLSGSQELCPAKITESVKRRQEAVRKSLEQKKRIEEEEKKKREQQKQREKKLQRIVAKRAQANDPHQTLAQISKSKLRQFRKLEKQRKKEYLEEMREMQERVSERPLLLEQVTQRNAKKAAEKRFADTLKENGLSEDFVNSKVPMAQKLFDESVNGVYLTNEDQESLKMDPVERAESPADQEEYQDDYEDVDESESESVEKYDREREEVEDASAEDQYSEDKESDSEDQESLCDP